MSATQDKNGHKGRPTSVDLWELPAEFGQILDSIRFFRRETDMWRVRALLPNSDTVDRKYRFRAALTRAVAKEGRATVERVMARSWKQLNRYLAGATIPVAVMELAAAMSDVTTEWIRSGKAETAHLFILDAASNPDTMLTMSGKDRQFVAGMAKKIASEFPALKHRLRLVDVDEIVKQNEVGRTREPEEADFRVPPGHIEIDRYELHASAGNGSKQFDERSSTRWTIPQELLRGFAGKADSLMSTDVVGDSMEPTLQDGQAIIVDKSARFDREAIYLLTVGDDLFVKRLRRVPGDDGQMSLSLISDNAAYPEMTLGPDTQERVRIIGRVIWPDTSRRRF